MPELPRALVVGAGPVGLTMAGELLRHGVPCRIVDSNDGPTPLKESRALGLQARTMEVFKSIGVAPEILAQSRVIHAISGFSEGRRVVHLTFDLSDLDTEFPHVYTLPQGKTERVLLAHLESLGGRVERSTKLGGLTQDAGGVSATLADGSGAESVSKFDWVIGCDGARSAVRKLLNLNFEGGEYEERFLLIDLDLKWSRPDDEVTILLTPEGPVVAFPLPEGRWRLVDTTGIIDSDDPGQIVARFRDLVTKNGFPDAEFGEVEWTSSFHLHRRVVDRYRVGRVFVAGDAAHLHSPAGGQGMNTGIQDAFNLAWKLGLVHSGASNDSLLDSYQPERRPVAIGVLKGSDRMTQVITFRNPLAKSLRDHLLDVLTEFDLVRRKVSHGMSELEIGYRSSPIVSEDRAGLLRSILPGGEGVRGHLDFSRGPHPGDRAPEVVLDGDKRLSDVLMGTQHTLLLFAPSADAFSDLLKGPHADRLKAVLVVRGDESPAWTGEILRDPDGVLHDRYGADADSFYLIRPDGYVGYRAQPADAGKLAGYLDRIFAKG